MVPPVVLSDHWFRIGVAESVFHVIAVAAWIRVQQYGYSSWWCSFSIRTHLTFYHPLQEV
jgi:hypothetical protein